MLVVNKRDAYLIIQILQFPIDQLLEANYIIKSKIQFKNFKLVKE